MKEWVCEDGLLKFVNDVIVGRKFIIFFKGVKCSLQIYPCY